MLEAEFKHAVSGLPFAKTAYFSSAGSTNDIVAGWASEGAKEICLAYADEQTKGRGRSGRSWLTPPGSALAFSILLNTALRLEPNLIGLVSGLGALAVCEALELYQLTPEIKWPNDVLLAGKKTCGVLAEAQWSGMQLKALVLGIGINVAPQSVPPQNLLNFPATCTEEALGEKMDSAELLRRVLESLVAWKDRLNEPSFVESWEKRLAYKGEFVRVEGSQNVTEGKILGLAGDGRLRLLTNGEERALNIGEIQIRR